MQSGTVSVPGLRREFDRLTGALARQDRAQAVSPQDEVAQLHRKVERALEERGARMSALSAPSRAIVAWLRTFDDPKLLGQYLAAVTRADLALRTESALRPRFRLPYWVEFRPMKGLYRLQPTVDGTRVVYSAPMVVFDQCLFLTLAAHASGRHRDRETIYRAMIGDQFQDLMRALDPSWGNAQDGLVHDLRASFDRLNLHYFGGSIGRPTIEWARTASPRKLGFFDPVGDRVVINALLDDPSIPSFVLDFVLYHELLHRQHGLDWRNGRAHAHTAQFRADERRFLRMNEARAIIDAMARSSRRR